MEKKKGAQYNIGAFALSAVLAVVVIAALTVAGELYKPLKNWLAETFTHHWVGKGVISFVGFYVVGFMFSFLVPSRDDMLPKLLLGLFWVSLLATGAILGFYYYETFIVTH